MSGGAATAAGAATYNPNSAANLAGQAADIFGIQQGLAQGGLVGNSRAFLNAGQLANSRGAFGGAPNTTVGGALGAGAGVLGMYSGLKAGGVLGYGGAAVGGLQTAAGVESMLGNAGAAGALGAAAGYVAAPLSLYSAIKGWQSGDTAGDTIRGAEAGASIGSVIPGVGTVIGAVVGGAVGALSSAFGGGKTSAEATMDRSIDSQLSKANDTQRASVLASMTPAQSFQQINGYMNAHDNSPGHSEPIQQVFGKNGVGNMFQQMMPAINQAVTKNPKLASLSPSQMYSQVVVPWLKSKGATISASARDVKGNPEGQNLIDSITNVIGDWQTGKINSKTALGVAGQSMNIPIYVGYGG